MTVAYIDPSLAADEIQQARPPGGLANFDANAAAANLAAVGQQPPVPAAAPAPPPVDDPPIPIPQQGAPGADGPHTPIDAGSTPASATAPPTGTDATTAPATAQPIAEPTPLGPPPKPPALTGDPAKDVQANIQYSRDLTDYHAQFLQHKAALDQRAAGVESHKANAELADAQVAERDRQQELARYAAERVERQKQIDAAVAERAEAHRDIEGASWMDKHTGAAIVAAIAGGIGAGLQNAAAAQLGQVGHAENEGLKTVNMLMDRDYAKRKDRLASASNAVLEARYGFKDAADNHRAALNDLDADFAAKQKLRAKEAEAQLKAHGADDATVAANAQVADGYAKASEAEARIHQREEEMGIQRQKAAAEAALTGTRLDLQREQIKATRESHHMAREARADARADKVAAAADKKAEAHEARIVRDPETGEPLGMAPSPRVVDTIAKDIAASRSYVEKANMLAAHIEKYGHILNPLSAEAKERESIAADVQSAGRQVSGIQASDAGQKLEHEMIGGLGVLGKGLRMADPNVLRTLAEHAKAKADGRLRSTLSPIPGSDKPPLPPAAAAPTRPAATPAKAPKLDGGDAEQMLKFHRAGDARFDGILKANGLI